MRLAIAVDPGPAWSWLERIDFRAAGLDPLFLRVGGNQAAAAAGETRTLRGQDRRGLLLPDLADLVAAIEDGAADGCLLVGRGPLATLLRAAAELAELPVAELVDRLDRLPGPGAERRGRPDLFLLTEPGLLAHALDDPRYGSTLVAVGHPGRDPELAAPGDAAPAADEGAAVDRGAAGRLLAFLDRWRRGALEPAVPELSVVVPAYNEEDNVALVCDRLLAALDGIAAEILIVDDASRDATFARARQQMWRSPRVRAFTKPLPRGMGNGIRFGLSHARARYVAVTMGDGSDEVAKIPEMLARVRDEGYALSIGSRYRSRRNYETVPRLYRFWSACFRLVARLLIGFRLSDYTNAFRVFDRAIFARYGPESGGFEISPEITFKAWFTSRRVAEVDVRHLKRASGQSSFSFLRAGPGYGKILLKAFVQRLTGRWFVLDW